MKPSMMFGLTAISAGIATITFFMAFVVLLRSEYLIGAVACAVIAYMLGCISNDYHGRGE